MVSGTAPFETDPYSLEYAVNYPTDVSESGARYETGAEHVAVGTHDGDRGRLYVDGSQVAATSYTDDVEMGELRLGRDFESDIQHLDGCISELRLYYTALDDKSVARLTTVMD